MRFKERFLNGLRGGVGRVSEVRQCGLLRTNTLLFCLTGRPCAPGSFTPLTPSPCLRRGGLIVNHSTAAGKVTSVFIFVTKRRQRVRLGPTGRVRRRPCGGGRAGFSQAVSIRLATRYPLKAVKKSRIYVHPHRTARHVRVQDTINKTLGNNHIRVGTLRPAAFFYLYMRTSQKPRER